jgi:predicted RNA-binding Zn-ribbon protein involved in translation (DUF1610 family)
MASNAHPVGSRVTSLPCPECGHYTVLCRTLANERGEHMHTIYTCSFWPSGQDAASRCLWEGWSVPGWDRNEDRSGTEPPC